MLGLVDMSGTRDPMLTSPYLSQYTHNVVSPMEASHKLEKDNGVKMLLLLQSDLDLGTKVTI